MLPPLPLRGKFRRRGRASAPGQRARRALAKRRRSPVARLAPLDVVEPETRASFLFCRNYFSGRASCLIFPRPPFPPPLPAGFRAASLLLLSRPRGRSGPAPPPAPIPASHLFGTPATSGKLFNSGAASTTRVYPPNVPRKSTGMLFASASLPPAFPFPLARSAVSSTALVLLLLLLLLRLVLWLLHGSSLFRRVSRRIPSLPVVSFPGISDASRVAIDARKSPRKRAVLHAGTTPTRAKFYSRDL